eukprot:753571-Hanusia_phi.AAC.6
MDNPWNRSGWIPCTFVDSQQVKILLRFVLSAGFQREDGPGEAQSHPSELRRQDHRESLRDTGKGECSKVLGCKLRLTGMASGHGRPTDDHETGQSHLQRAKGGTLIVKAGDETVTEGTITEEVRILGFPAC